MILLQFQKQHLSLIPFHESLQTDSTNGFKTPKQRLESSLNNAEDCESHNYLNVLFKVAH